MTGKDIPSKIGIGILVVASLEIGKVNGRVNAKALLRKVHPPQEVLEAGVGAEGALPVILSEVKNLSLQDPLSKPDATLGSA